ncbi:hypothetical protein QTP88_001495 [Uroleucon formosanum]
MKSSRRLPSSNDLMPKKDKIVLNIKFLNFSIYNELKKLKKIDILTIYQMYLNVDIPKWHRGALDNFVINNLFFVSPLYDFFNSNNNDNTRPNTRNFRNKNWLFIKHDSGCINKIAQPLMKTDHTHLHLDFNFKVLIKML